MSAPAYREADGADARDAVTLGLVPMVVAEADGYGLPTPRDLGLRGVGALMTPDIREWTDGRIGDGKSDDCLCKPGACDFHSSGLSGRGVGFGLFRPETGRR